MGVLPRLTKLGGAREDTQNTYKAPTFSIPWMAAKYIDVTDPLRAEDVRANDAVVQAIVPGPKQATWEITTNQYADIIGNWFVAMGLFDTVTAGISTTLAASSSAGATTVSSTASIPQNGIVMIGSGAALEYATVSGAPTGSGPYSLPVTGSGSGGGLLYAHASSDPIVSQSTHVFKQNRSFSTIWPSYSFSTDDGVDQLGWPGQVAQELALKIDPKGLVTFAMKFTGLPSATQATFAYGASKAQPVQGWAWTLNNAGASSTRGLTMDITLKRTGDVIHASTGQQGPREVFPGALEIDGVYKAIFENDTDIQLFRSYQQTATTHTLTQPVSLGGSMLAVVMSQSGYTTADVANTGSYLQLDQNVTGIQNGTDGGVTAVTLSNYVSTAY
jgi:hypothetical protein